MNVPRLAATMLGLAALGLAASRSIAQDVSATVTGTVRDTSGRPLVNAVVALDPDGIRRVARVDERGEFRFTNVAAGSHALRTTWIGYKPDDRSIEVSGNGVHVDVMLVSLPYRLDTLAIVARRTGIIGTAVTRAPLRPLKDVDVLVLGSRQKTRSNADGRFEMLVPEGAYVVVSRRDGYKSRSVSVAVPNEGAVEVVLVMDSVASKADRFVENRFREMETRIHAEPPRSTALVAQQELLSQRGQTLKDALRYAPSMLAKPFVHVGMNDVCSIFVDGERDFIHALADFHPEEVLFVELHEARCGEPVPGKPGILVIKSSGKAGVSVWIWLKH